ncbi:hypothetical protein, partial [Methanolapillus africanus]|uniref:hypothetical protein n=1 Tax=Methanolapillus africanus TaxID=3028297 RepID=UPI0030B87B66
RVVIAGTNGDELTSNSAKLTVLSATDAISITTQPADKNISIGQNATFSVTATNANGYQWQESADNTTFTDISGATSAGYTTADATAAGMTYFRVVIAGTNGDELTSNSAKLTVLSATDAISITTQPADKNISIGQNATFSVVATNANGYQWQESADNTTFTDISGATSAGYTTADATAAGMTYYRVVIAGTNGDELTSNSAKLTVLSATDAISITTQPADKNISIGQNATFSVVATNANGYQWQESADNTTFTDISGATSAGYTTADATVAGMTYFRVVIAGTNGDELTSNSAKLTVLSATDAISITTQPADKNISIGQNATFSVTATNANGYQWQESADNTTFTDISGATSAGYTTADATAAGMTYFRVVIAGTNGDELTSNSAKLTVLSATDAISITTQPADKNISIGRNATFSVVATNANGYQWQESADNTTFTDISGATSAGYTTADAT